MRLGVLLARGLAARILPRPDSGPADGGLGRHPLGLAVGLDGDIDVSDAPADPALALALAAASGDRAAVQAGVEALPPSAEPDPVALLHLATAHAWAPLPPEAERRLAGRAQGLAQAIARARVAAGPAAALQDCALFVAALTWPALPGARAAEGLALAGLGRSLPAALSNDGGPRGSPAEAAQLLQAVTLAWAWADANGIGFPARLRPLVVDSASALDCIAGPLGALPGPPAAPLLPFGRLGLTAQLINRLVAWEALPGPGRGEADPFTRRLTGREPIGPLPTLAGKSWAQWAWREQGSVVAWREIKRRPSRLWVQAEGCAAWDIGDPSGRPLNVFTVSNPPAALRQARVDGHKAKVELQGLGVRRELLARQARVLLTDQGQRALRFAIDPRWSLQPAGEGWEAKLGELTLALKLDPRWTWQVRPGEVAGEGPPDDVKTSFELR